MAVKSASPYGEAEDEMVKLLSQDPYFSSDASLTPSLVQTLGHVSSTRGTGALLGSCEQVDEEFQCHAEAIRVLDMLSQSLKTVATEFSASLKALKKLKELEVKEIEKEKLKQQKALERKEVAEKKKQEKKAAAAAAAAAASKDKTEANAEAAKRRRASAKISAEMVDSDPNVLKARFPDNQLHVCETVDTCF